MSLLALTGMFIFGGKKEKKKADERSEREEYERELEELSKRYGIPKENIKKVALFRVYNGEQVRILRKALGIPEKDI